MATGKLKVEGQREVQRAFDTLSSDVENLSDASAEVAQSLIGSVRNKTRRKTGDLAGAWIAGGEPTRATFGNPQSYALAQELGTGEVSATHAVSAAYEDNRDAVIAAYSGAIRKRAKRANVRTD